MKSSVNTVSPLNQIARKYGISAEDLRESLNDNKTREKRTKRRIRQREREVAECKRKRMENLLTVRLPMDCVNYIIEFMDPKIRFELDRLLTQDKIERVPVILSTMDWKEILRHLNYGRLHFIIDEAEDINAYDEKQRQFWEEKTSLRTSLGSNEYYAQKIYLTSFRLFEHYRQHFYNSFNNTKYNFDRDKEYMDMHSRRFYDYYTEYYSKSYYLTSQYKIRNFGYELTAAFVRMHEREKSVEVHQTLEKMLNVFMRLPKKFYSPKNRK